MTAAITENSPITDGAAADEPGPPTRRPIPRVVDTRRLLPSGRRARTIGRTLAAAVVLAVVANAVIVQRDADAAATLAQLAAVERAGATSERAVAQSRVDELIASIEQARTSAGGATGTAGAREASMAQFDASITQVQGDLAGVDADLADTAGRAAVQAGQTDRLRTCLAALTGAQDAVRAGRPGDATARLQAGATSCRQVEIDAGNRDPAYAYDFADPYVLVTADGSYAFGSNGPGGHVQALRSNPYGGWDLVGDALAGLPPWARPGRTWAPSVLANGSTYVLYYTVTDAASGQQCISVATAAAPAGPYADRTAWPLVCQHDLGGSIDPSPVRGPDGVAHLLWRSDGRPGQLYSQRLGTAGVTVEGEPVRLLTADLGWEGQVIEGPSMVEDRGRWLLAYSANRWDTAAYATGQAVCDGPLGPCRKFPQPVLASGAGLAGPGGLELFRDRTGQLQAAFHAWEADQVAADHPRHLHVAPARVGADGRLSFG